MPLTDNGPCLPRTTDTFSVPNTNKSLKKDLVLTDSEMTVFVNFANIIISQLSLSVYGGILKPISQ